MTVCIVSHPGEDAPVRLDAAEERIATRAEQASNPSCRVAVVHEQVAFDAADQAASALGLTHAHLDQPCHADVLLELANS